MQIQFLDYRDKKATHIVRVMSPMGVYPSKSIVLGESGLYISEDICFSVVEYFSDDPEPNDYYSEVEWATIKEIRLYASLLLSINRDFTYCRIYPFRTSHKISITLGTPIAETFETIKARLIEIMNEEPKLIDGHLHSTNPYRNSRGISLPKAGGGIEYDLRFEGYDTQLQKILIQNIGITDYLLIRGLNTLLRSAILTTHYHFLEEAINTTFISLEASYRLVLRAIDGTGNKNPTSKDAAEYISKAFGEESLERYFKEYYDSRIMTFHPESRFGIFPHAPLMADDCYDLFDDLIEVYRYLICGYVVPKL